MQKCSSGYRPQFVIFRFIHSVCNYFAKQLHLVKSLCLFKNDELFEKSKKLKHLTLEKSKKTQWRT